MNAVIKSIILLVLAGAVGFLISRFPDTRRRMGGDLDDALYRGGVRALWFSIAIGAIALVALWLLL
jgi:hypothetical protein